MDTTLGNVNLFTSYSRPVNGYVVRLCITHSLLTQLPSNLSLFLGHQHLPVRLHSLANNSRLEEKMDTTLSPKNQFVTHITVMSWLTKTIILERWVASPNLYTLNIQPTPVHTWSQGGNIQDPTWPWKNDNVYDDV